MDGTSFRRIENGTIRVQDASACSGYVGRTNEQGNWTYVERMFLTDHHHYILWKYDPELGNQVVVRKS